MLSKKSKTLEGESRKSPSRVKKILLALLSILLLVGAVCFYRYQTDSLEGDWTSQSAAKKLKKAFTKEVANVDESFGIKTEDIIANPKLTMSVKNDKAILTVKIPIKKKKFSQKMLEFVKKQLEQSLKEQHMSLDQLDPEIKEMMEKTIPSLKDIEDRVDLEMEKTAHEMDGTYHKATSLMSMEVAEGNVNRLMRKIDIKSINEKNRLLSKKDLKGYFDYSIQGKKVSLKGKEKLVFIK
ncbi:hypothetical protein [Streptococcus catagoni]|uniref:hypothetical protein n=1 Tax=Streptococcus catagoni TaxID=2654874 RepID=UPI00140786E0|nr:hypothetical protein [Streptococcus catagoni]